MTPEEQAASLANLDFSLLDGTLDDIDDLPQFLVFPTGAYHVVLAEGLQRKNINNHPALECAMTLVEIKELSNPIVDEVNKPNVGDICTVAWMLDNPTGAGFCKMNVLDPIGKKLGTKNNNQIVTGSKGVQAIIVMQKTTKVKDGISRDYGKILRFVPI